MKYFTISKSLQKLGCHIFAFLLVCDYKYHQDLKWNNVFNFSAQLKNITIKKDGNVSGNWIAILLYLNAAERFYNLLSKVVAMLRDSAKKKLKSCGYLIHYF